MTDASVIESPSVFIPNIYIDVDFMDLIENPLNHISQLITHSLKVILFFQSPIIIIILFNYTFKHFIFIF